MNSFFKGSFHTLITILALALPGIIAHHASLFNMTIGTALGILVNWALSHTIPTTTGASAKQ